MVNSARLGDAMRFGGLPTKHFIRARWALGFLAVLAGAGSALAQQISTDLFVGMKWRLVGPHRAGRVTAVTGIAGRPAIYYLGTPGGGVWKTTDGGRVWKPIFDELHVASIGALALAASNPDVLYVGTGEQTEGSGVYKSTDAGVTWQNVGLAETRFINSVLVHPRDPNVVLVGVFGDDTPGEARGVYKSRDGGKSWKKVLYIDDHTGIADMCFDPGQPQVVYATSWRMRPQPGEKKPEGPDSMIYKSTDAGETWKPVGESGLPGESRGRIGVAVAAGNGGKRVFAILHQGFFRSEDAGATWQRITADTRVIGSGYFSKVFADPKNAELVYVMQTSVYRSSDGGRTFAAFKGAPSGEDHHALWIAPDDPERMLLGSDQGATITVDGGKTWSSWFNQPTGQFYHVSTDNAFPYHLYAAQQDSGSVVVPSRSDFGEITYRDWYSSGGFESGYIAADPLNPNVVYSIGWFGAVLRLDRGSNQIATVFVPPANYRTAWETPLVFSPRDPHALYYGAQFVLKTTDGGLTWKEISADLTTKAKETTAPKPKGGGGGHLDRENADEHEAAQMQGHNVLQTIAPSPVEAAEIWVGTSSGLIYLTHDTASWQDVTPAGLPEKRGVILIEASPHDANAAYAAIEVQHDRHAYFYRTRDAGKSWEKIVTGLPDAGIARVVREDTARPGLLYAGTETGVYVSFDGGDHWQSLQRNLPTASVRDLAVHGRDLVAATFGRGLWILDELTPLRQMNAAVANSAVHFFHPESALRVRWDNHPDTPLSAETPAGQNPPDGALIDYYFKTAPKGEVTLEIFDAKGNRMQHFSSVAPPPDATPANVPEYWFAPPEVLPAKAGVNRFVWNLRYPHPAALTYGYFGEHLDYIEYTLPDHAIPGETPRDQPPGPLVVPGQYELALTVEGKTYRQKLAVELDPRVHLSQADLAAQLELARKLADWMDGSASAYEEVSALSKALAERKKALASASALKGATDAASELEKQFAALESGSEDAPGFGPLNRDIARYLTMVESADLRPTESARRAAGEACRAYKKDVVLWNKLNAEGVPALNRLLEPSKGAALTPAKPSAEPSCPE
jgi:photosystem II stability/assembly factor-like uncharacterized protein